MGVKTITPWLLQLAPAEVRSLGQGLRSSPAHRDLFQFSVCVEPQPFPIRRKEGIDGSSVPGRDLDCTLSIARKINLLRAAAASDVGEVAPVG